MALEVVGLAISFFSNTCKLIPTLEVFNFASARVALSNLFHALFTRSVPDQ